MTAELGRRCQQALYAQIQWAAWMKGVQLIPGLSMMHFGYAPGETATKLAELLQSLRPTFDGASVKTADGRWVVETDGLCDLGPDESLAVFNYMVSQSDIFWIDNLACLGPATYAGTNVYRGGLTTDVASQNALSNAYQDHYRVVVHDERHGLHVCRLRQSREPDLPDRSRAATQHCYPPTTPPIAIP